MKRKGFKRSSLRAPISKFVLCNKNGTVFKVKTVNISEQGVLLEKFPADRSIVTISSMIELPLYPRLPRLSFAEISYLRGDVLKSNIIRLKIRITRRITDDLEKSCDTGGEFMNPTKMDQMIISNYVTTYTRNIIHLLSLFENHRDDPEKLRLLYLVASLLGYDSSISIKHLRQNVLHDYQSLKSL